MSRIATSRLPRLLSARAIHEETGLPLSSVYAILARREMPVIMLGESGTSKRVREDDFLDWLEAHREVAQ